MVSLRAIDIEVVAGGETILEPISVQVRPGEVTSVLGPNGAGKSTLLDVLAGRQCRRGRVELGAEPVEALDNEAVARRRGVLSQSVQVGFGFEVAKVVRLGGLPWRGTGRPLADRRVEECLDEVGMAWAARRSVTSLSGGERRRVHLARVLAQVGWPSAPMDGRFVLFDEPLSSLDIAERARVLELIARLRDRGVGLLCVFHELESAARISDRVLLLRSGEPVASGPSASVMTSEQLERCFGTPVEVWRNPSGVLSIQTPPIKEHPSRDEEQT